MATEATEAEAVTVGVAEQAVTTAATAVEVAQLSATAVAQGATEVIAAGANEAAFKEDVNDALGTRHRRGFKLELRGIAIEHINDLSQDARRQNEKRVCNF